MQLPNVFCQLSLENTSRYLRWTFMLVACLLSGLMFYATADGRFYLNHEDEAIYYGSAKLFAATNSLKAQSCSHEDVSPVGSFNWYGPGFHVVYGTLFKVFGEGPIVFIAFHFFLAVLIIATIFSLPIKEHDKWIISLCLLASHQLYFYIFTFFPETLILFFSTVLTALLYMTASVEDRKKRRMLELAFVICCIIFTVFRVTMVFWLAGCIPLANSKAGYVIRTFFFLFAIALSLVYTKYMLAPALDATFKAIEYLFKGDIINFVLESFDVFFKNLGALITSDSLTIQTMNFFIVALLISYLLTRRKILLPAIFIVFTIMCVYMAYYNVKSFFLVKQTAMFIPLIFVFFVAGQDKQWVKYALIAISIALLPRTFIHTRKIIRAHRQAYDNYEKHIGLEESFAKIPAHIRREESTILWCYTEYDFGRHTEAILPFATSGNEPILFTSNIVESNANASEKFRRHNKMTVHYYLSRYPLDDGFLKEILVTPYYHLYEVVNP